MATAFTAGTRMLGSVEVSGNTSGERTSNSKFTSRTYITCVFRHDPDGNGPRWSGVPKLRVFGKGLKVRSITSTGTLTAARTYSNNRVLCLLDYLTKPIFGPAENLSLIHI